MKKVKYVPGVLLVLIGGLIVLYQFINAKLFIYTACALIVLLGIYVLCAPKNQD